MLIYLRPYAMAGAAQAICAFTLLLAGAATATAQTSYPDEQNAFWASLQALCGQAFAGELTIYHPEADENWIGKPLQIHFAECSPNEIKVPLVVAENHPRTWVLSRSDHGLALKHEHREEDGSERSVSWFGGKTTDAGRAWRQVFVADDYSKSLFYAEGFDVSAQNIWYMEVHPGQTFAYGLTRPNRHARAEFDLTRPIEPPSGP